MMATNREYGLVLTTTANREDAAALAHALLQEKLAACVQVLPIESFYIWKGQTANDPELLLLVKTKVSLFEKAIARIKEIHKYDIPEIVATPFTAGLEGYFGWIDEVTS